MDIVSYILSRKYTNETAIQFGGLKGAPCKVKNISKDNGQTTITFEWKNDAGETRESSFVVEDGLSNWVSGRTYEVGDIVNKDGSLYTCKTANSDTTFDYAKWSAVVGVELTQAQYDALPDSQKMNGTIYFITDGIGNGGGQITQPLTATVEIGSVTNGKTYAKGTEIEQIIRDMLIKYLAPAVTLTTTPATKLYDIVTDSIDTILLKAAVTKKTNPVTKVAFYVGDTLLNEVTTGVASGGNFQYQYTPATAIRSDVTFKATATDGKQTSTSTYNIKFVAKSYYGICDANVSDPDETIIKSGTGNLKDTRTLTYSGITTNWGKVFYAYPKSFGALTYIKDEINNINYFDSFQRSDVTIDGIAYYCYTLIEPTAAENNQITFK